MIFLSFWIFLNRLRVFSICFQFVLVFQVVRFAVSVAKTVSKGFSSLPVG